MKPTNISKPIGHVIGGSIDEVTARLHVSPRSVREGTFLTIEDNGLKFFGLLSKMELGATNSKFAEGLGVQQLPHHAAALLKGQTLFTNIGVYPALMLDKGRIIPIKSLPEHHTMVSVASEDDIRTVFGDPNDPANFVIGTTREQGHPVCINLDKFVQRSSGVFGASGTGKSFTVRMLLAGLIHHDQASVLILDMHNEYAFDDIASDTGERVIGLKTKFPGAVRIVGLGAKGNIRGQAPDFSLEIASSDITTGDIELLTAELGLKETTATTLEALYAEFGHSWFQAFKAMRVGATVPVDPKQPDGRHVPAPDSVHAWATRAGVNIMAAEGLHSKMTRVFRLPYINKKPAVNGITEIIKMLESGKHIVLSFGSHESDLDYMLVSNILTRRIRNAWEDKTNAYRNHGNKGRAASMPRPLTIVVEEAHKLLCPALANQTTFGTIAREMRKFFVTLTIIDQRPSQISSEIMSQLGTRVSGWLGDEDDIQSALAGLPGKDSLRGMLSRLSPKLEALIVGFGVPMPLPLKTRRYDDTFWKELLGNAAPQASTPQPVAMIADGEPLSSQSADDLLRGLGY